MKKKILLSLLASTILVAQDIELKPLQITSTAKKNTPTMPISKA